MKKLKGLLQNLRRFGTRSGRFVKAIEQHIDHRVEIRLELVLLVISSVLVFGGLLIYFHINSINSGIREVNTNLTRISVDMGEFKTRTFADIGEVKNAINKNNSKIGEIKTHLEYIATYLEQIGGKEIDGVIITRADAFAAADEMEEDLLESWGKINELQKENELLKQKLGEAEADIKRLELEINGIIKLSSAETEAMQEKLRELKERVRKAAVTATDDEENRSTLPPDHIPVPVANGESRAVIPTTTQRLPVEEGDKPVFFLQ